MTNRRDDETTEGSSPACSMHEADDVYMGYMAREELITFLNELLEERSAPAPGLLSRALAWQAAAR